MQQRVPDESRDGWLGDTAENLVVHHHAFACHDAMLETLLRNNVTQTRREPQTSGEESIKTAVWQQG